MGNQASTPRDLQWMRYRIERKEYEEVLNILQKDHSLINEFLQCNHLYSPLMKAANINDFHLVKLFVEKYKCDINLKNSKGKTAIIFAINRNKIQVVQYLLEKGSEIDYQTDAGLKPIDFAILAGFYQIALLLYKRSSDNKLKSTEQYRNLAKLYKYRYVNYDTLLNNLLANQNAEQVGDDFLIIPNDPYVSMIDPVVDPRQSWKQFASRVYKFQNAPLIQRENLPIQAQPQNRKMGWVRQFFDSKADTRKNSRKYREIRNSISRIRCKSNITSPSKPINTLEHSDKENQFSAYISQQKLAN